MKERQVFFIFISMPSNPFLRQKRSRIKRDNFRLFPDWSGERLAQLQYAFGTGSGNGGGDTAPFFQCRAETGKPDKGNTFLYRVSG
jgi:hypothetical protein